jgi:sugar lactone lactonase YvrE
LPLRPAGSSIVFATHDPELVLRIAEHVVCLDAGRVIYAGSVHDLYHSPRSEQEAWFLGPINWFDAISQVMWLSGRTIDGDLALRPERLRIESDETGSHQVAHSTPLGAITETMLAHGLTNESNTSSEGPLHFTRTVWHRTESPALPSGTRVALRILMLLCLFALSACRPSSEEPTLAVKSVDYWSIPPEGTRIPAPRAIHAGPHDEVFVLDNAGRVLVYGPNGAIVRKWWMPEYSVGKPEGIYVLIDGRIAVADTHYHRVVFFDYEGNFLGSFGSLGREPGEFIYPVKLTQDPDGNLYVCEYGDNDRVQKFTADGKFITQFGSFGTEPGQFQRPSGIVWRDHKLYIVDAFNNRIQVYTDEGEYEGVLNSDADALSYPYDINLSPSGDLFIAEYGANRVSKFDLTGKLVARYGTGGGGEGQFSTPWSLAVDQHNRVLVADTGNRRVVVLEVGR